MKNLGIFMDKHFIANIKFKELLLPTLLIAMALNISAVIDSFFVASYVGANALAAIELLEPLILVITILEWLFGVGGQILSLNRKGEFDEEGSNKYFTVALITTIIVCVILLIVCNIGINQLIYILHPTQNILPYVKEYAPFLFLCFPISTGLGVLCQFIRVDGQPNFASELIILANIINCILNFIFLEHFHMGIKGVALATLFGYSIAIIISLKYYFDSKRTYKCIISKISIKNWFKSTWEMCKIGFPNASTGLFEVILVYIVNRLLMAIMGEIGLVAYTACMDALLIISILIVGVIETFSSIVPLFYTQYDYKNIKYLFNKTIRITLICAILFTIFLWAFPNLFLMLYSLNSHPMLSTLIFALRIYSLCFIPSVFITIFIFYYESIERSAISTFLSVICMLIGPLLAIFGLLPFIGINSIWISFTIANILAIIIALIYVKVTERRESEYSGILLIKKDIEDRSKNFSLTSKNDEKEIMSYLKDLNADENNCKDVEIILNYLFEHNSEKTVVEILVINYDDNITVNIKDNGKKGLFEDIKKEIGSNKDNIKYTNVLGFNNIKYEINKN